MKNMKRLDIVVDHLHTKRILKLLKQLNVEGYSVIPGVRGSGHRGTVHADGLTDSASNDLIFTAIPESQLDSIADPLRDMLKQFGGICLISDTQWLD